MTDYLGPLTFGSGLTSSNLSTFIGDAFDMDTFDSDAFGGEEWIVAGSDVGTYTLKDFKVAAGVATIDVSVRAASADALAVALEALVAQVKIGNTYAHFQPGVTNPVVYRVLGVIDFVQSAPDTWHAFQQRVLLTLALAGQPAGALTTLYTAQDVSAPASVSLAILLGTNPTMLDVTIDDQAGTDMHSVWCALAPTALSDAKWLVLASALTWTGMSSGTGATLWGNVSRYCTSSAYHYAPLDTSQYPAGKYRLAVRASQEAGTGYVMDSQNAVAVAITGATQHLTVIGDLDLPVADTAPGVAANLTLSVKSDGANDCIVNAFVLIPLDLGYFSWHPATPTTEIDQLDVGPTGVFMDGICNATYLQGGILTPSVLAAHTGTMIATASPTGNDWPADWGKTDANVTADTSRFKCVGASKYAYFAATNLATPLVIPGAWYELFFGRQVDDYVAGAVTGEVVWEDVDGNVVRTDVVWTTGANGAPVAITVYAKAPAHAARALVRLGTNASGNVTAYFWSVAFRRCPLRLIVVTEDAAGALTNYVHPVHLTVKYGARYEVAR